MPLDLLNVSTQIRGMGDLLVSRRADDERRLELALSIFETYKDRWDDLARRAETVPERVAVPTGPLDERLPPPPRLDAYTALAADGSEIDPERHGAGGNFYLINIGRDRIP